MPYTLDVCLQDEDKIVACTMDAATGRLTPHAAVAVAGGASVLTLSPDRHVLYVGHRGLPAISSFRIDPATSGLTPQGTVASTHAPTFLATDRTGHYLLSAYYQGGYAAVHPLGADGAVGAPPLDSLITATGAHAIQTDPSKRVRRPEHLLPNSPHVVGAVPICGQPRPQQPCGVRRRHHHWGIDGPRARSDRSGPQCLLFGPCGPVRRRRRRGVGPAGGVPHPWRDGCPDTPGDVCRGPAAYGGAGHRGGRLGTYRVRPPFG
jgi:hypothetical protein